MHLYGLFVTMLWFSLSNNDHVYVCVCVCVCVCVRFFCKCVSFSLYVSVSLQLCSCFRFPVCFLFNFLNIVYNVCLWMPFLNLPDL